MVDFKEIYNEIDIECISETDTVRMETIQKIFIKHGLGSKADFE